MTDKPLTQNDVAKLAVTAYAITHPKETANFIKGILITIAATAIGIYFIAMNLLNKLTNKDVIEIVIGFGVLFTFIILIITLATYYRQLFKFIVFMIKFVFKRLTA